MGRPEAGRGLEVGVFGEAKENEAVCLEDGKNADRSINQNKGGTRGNASSAVSPFLVQIPSVKPS